MPKIQIRRDTAANWKTANPTLLAGEWALETDTKKMKIGDGSTAYNLLPYSTVEENNEWVKPDDWVDIRSGALPKSIYLLVGHKADYSSYKNLGFNVVLSDTTHNFKVYIDHNLQGTYASGADVALSWQDLNLSTGSQTTFPEALKTHTIRIVPENSADTIQEYQAIRVAASGAEPQGILWMHFALTNSLARVKLCDYNTQIYQPDLVAITALGNHLHISGENLTQFIGNTSDRYTKHSSYLAKLPTLEVDTVYYIGGMLNHAGPLKKAKIVVNNSIYAKNAYGNSANSTSFASGNLEEIEINKPIIFSNETTQASSLFRISKIKKLPAFDFAASKQLRLFITENTNLEDTVLDVSEAADLQVISVYGTASHRQDGLKGLYVSNQAPFDYATAPQIDIKYTGLSRAALVELFKSMPTVTDSQVCDVTGCMGADDLTAEDLAIATNKGWTITR